MNLFHDFSGCPVHFCGFSIILTGLGYLFVGVRRCALVTASDPDLCVACIVFHPNMSAT